TTFTGGQAADLVALVLHHDDDIEIFLNGNPVFHRQGWNDSYGAFDVTESVAPALKTGENILAVQMQQGTGGQYFDLALLLGTVSE
ncbi:MAG: hypothetical protein IT368_02405, partial [Candidatus Hydrogenedentes bacterium]|nr:hypothetical protein [Candidatus Hydrogenedentota bacterium]